MYELKVDGMTCGGCASAISKTLKALDPAAEVNVDLPSKKVQVKSERKLKEIAETIEDAGFSVKSSVAIV